MYTEAYRGGVGKFAISVSPNPTSTTNNPADYPVLSTVRPGLHLPQLALQLCVCALGGVVFTAIFVSILILSGRRLGPYGSVRKVRRFRQF
ncbi:MAG TPA: hypothetical protein VFN61_16480 [Acidimicrobiales bacterium]|nr:hypothetical protein [Acidimicrobiales bacterium]